MRSTATLPEPLGEDLKSPRRAEQPNPRLGELREWLEWGGSRLLAMNIRGTRPASFRSFWPDYGDEATSAYGYTQERLRPALPSSHEIALMDQIATLPSLITDVLQRRIVSSRSLVTPVAGRYLFSWVKIATLLHMERRTVAALYVKGLRNLDGNLPKIKRDAIRKTFNALSQ